MPSVRYAPTNSFISHTSGTRLERARFIIIDDDLSAFCPASLPAAFGGSDEMRHCQMPQPQPVGGSAGGKPKIPITASDVLIKGNICANIGQKDPSLQDPIDNDYIDGGKGQNEKQKEGDKFSTSLHSYYHHAQAQNITKFIYWSHDATYKYIPQITLLFKELKGKYTITKFDWKQNPHASVFMCNSNGGVEKLVFGDDTISGLGFISLGEPIGNTATYDMESSFISLIPGSGHADQIFNILMDNSAKEIQRPQWDKSLSSAILSSSQSGEEFLMLKSTFSKKKTSRVNYHSYNFPDNSEKQLVITKASCVAGVLRIGSDNTSQMFRPGSSSTQIATKIGAKASSLIQKELSKGAKHMAGTGNKHMELAAVTCGGKTIMAFPKLHLGESNKSKGICERPPRLPHTHAAIQIADRVTNTGSLSNNVIVGIPGSTFSTRFHGKSFGGQTHTGDDNGDAKAPERVVPLAEGMYFQEPGTNSSFVISDAIYDVVGGDKEKLPTNRKSTSPGSVSEAEDHCKKAFSCPEPHMPSAPNTFSSDPTCVSGDKIPVFSPSTSTTKSNLHTPDSAPSTTYLFDDKKPIPPEFRSSKFDLRGLPRTCVPSAYTASDPRQAPQTLPHAFSYEIFKSDDPVFNGCIIRRGFHPIYPSGQTPKMEFESRTGGLQNWYKWPPVQVAREYLPQGMKETDWSWTDNDISGEFIPGGIAW